MIEIMVSLGVLIVLILIIATSLNTLRLGRGAGYQAQAYRLADEELQTVKNLPPAEITNRANADFSNIFYNQGAWEAVADATAPSSPNTIALASPLSILATGLTGAVILPEEKNYTDFSLEANIKILAPAPASIKSGLIFRAKDAKNYYRLALENSFIRLEKIAGGSAVTLWSSGQTFAPGTWYKIKVSMTSTTMEVFLNDASLGTVADSTFSSGKLGFFTINNTKISLDNVRLIEGGNDTAWNFDADAAGAPPPTWQRFGLYDLPDAVGYLTIENFISGVETLKKITVRITWVQEGSTKSVQIQTVKNL